MPRAITRSLVLLIASWSLSGCSCESRAEASTEPPRLRRTPMFVSVAGTMNRGAEVGEHLRADADGDGIDDTEEADLARKYFPYFSSDPREDCGRHGVLFRVTPHPDDPTKIAIWYVVLFERDCGLHGIGAHVGDDEVFGELIDPNLPAPEGILAVRAISHQNTTCERASTCGKLPGCQPCDTAEREGAAYPVVYSSFRKHGNYANAAACNSWLCDFHACGLSPTPDAPMFVNAGEPARPLVRDLTAAGLVTGANGWTEQSLMNFDPWSERNFGGAGDVTDDLEDESFLISPGGCGSATSK